MLLIAFAIIAGMLAVPLGMLPSILLFRDLADGKTSSERTERAYAIVLWSGIILAWLTGSAAIFAIGSTVSF